MRLPVSRHVFWFIQPSQIHLRPALFRSSNILSTSAYICGWFPLDTATDSPTENSRSPIQMHRRIQVSALPQQMTHDGEKAGLPSSSFPFFGGLALTWLHLSVCVWHFSSLSLEIIIAVRRPGYADAEEGQDLGESTKEPEEGDRTDEEEENAGEGWRWETSTQPQRPIGGSGEEGGRISVVLPPKKRRETITHTEE